MCLTFYYYLNVSVGNGILPTMIVELNQLNTNSTLSSVELARIEKKSLKTDLRQSQNWSKHNVTINNQGNRIMLQFVGVITQKNQFIALDDISLTSGTCGKPLKYNKFPCVANPKQKTDFVNYSKVCDFVIDCSSGIDEHNCGYQCNFSNSSDFDGWTVKNVTSTFLRVDLSTQKASPFKNIMPLNDHKSQQLYSGYYLRLYDQPGPFVESPEANFESPWIQNSGPLCSFAFYYYLSDPLDKKALLRVKIIEPNNPL